MAAHLDTCPVCDRTLQELEQAEEPVLTYLGASPPPEILALADDKAFRWALEKVRAIPLAMGADQSGQAQEGIGPQAIPKVIGHYCLLEQLATGGMGEVYKAWHCDLEKVVALKILAPHLWEMPKR
jgi:hypothetical protein